MREVKAITYDRNDPCPRCNFPRKWEWYDVKQTNGRSETRYGFDKICGVCVTRENNGRPPLGLQDLNQIRERGISKEQYYQEHGY